MMPQLGKTIIIIALILLIIGLIIYFAGDKFSWFGNLPGDIKVKRDHFRFYFPVTSMILLSIFLSGILWLIRKLF